VAGRVLDQLGDLTTPGHRNLAAVNDEQRVAFEKVLHRLVVLGVVDDYTVKFSAKSFDVGLTGAPQTGIAAAYSRYIAAFSTARSIRETERANALVGSDHRGFVVKMLELYLAFVYDVIERGRRRALAEMLAATKTRDAGAFRERILRYLEATEYSEQLERILEDPQAGLGLVIPILDDLLTPNEAAEARGQVARYLETYPDHPALLLLRALTEALCRDADPRIVIDNLEAWMGSAVSRYVVAEETMLAASAYAVKRLAPRDAGLAVHAERLAMGRFPKVDQIRALVRLAGVENMRVAPWFLLKRHASQVLHEEENPSSPALEVTK